MFVTRAVSSERFGGGSWHPGFAWLHLARTEDQQASFFSYFASFRRYQDSTPVVGESSDVPRCRSVPLHWRRPPCDLYRLSVLPAREEFCGERDLCEDKPSKRQRRDGGRLSRGCVQRQEQIHTDRFWQTLMCAMMYHTIVYQTSIADPCSIMDS